MVQVLAEEARELLDGGAHVLLPVVQVDMACAVDPVDLLGPMARWNASTLIQEVTARMPTIMSRGRCPISGILDCDIWSSPDGSGQRLMVLTAEPGSASHDALRILTSWTADQR
ncbi:hypothetical protein GCM10009577_07210 [Streptomyces javensis]